METELSYDMETLSSSCKTLTNIYCPQKSKTKEKRISILKSLIKDVHIVSGIFILKTT